MTTLCSLLQRGKICRDVLTTLQSDMCKEYSMRTKSDIEVAHELLVCDGDDKEQAKTDFIHQCVRIANGLDNMNQEQLRIKEEK